MKLRPSNKIQINTVLSSGFRNPNIDDVGKIRENRGYLIVPNPMLLPGKLLARFESICASLLF